jgi:hypothetical protein
MPKVDPVAVLPAKGTERRRRTSGWDFPNHRFFSSIDSGSHRIHMHRALEGDLCPSRPRRYAEEHALDRAEATGFAYPFYQRAFVIVHDQWHPSSLSSPKVGSDGIIQIHDSRAVRLLRRSQRARAHPKPTRVRRLRHRGGEHPITVALHRPLPIATLDDFLLPLIAWRPSRRSPPVATRSSSRTCGTKPARAARGRTPCGRRSCLGWRSHSIFGWEIRRVVGSEGRRQP